MTGEHQFLVTQKSQISIFASISPPKRVLRVSKSEFGLYDLGGCKLVGGTLNQIIQLMPLKSQKEFSMIVDVKKVNEPLTKERIISDLEKQLDSISVNRIVGNEKEGAIEYVFQHPNRAIVLSCIWELILLVQRPKDGFNAKYMAAQLYSQEKNSVNQVLLGLYPTHLSIIKATTLLIEYSIDFLSIKEDSITEVNVFITDDHPDKRIGIALSSVEHVIIVIETSEPEQLINYLRIVHSSIIGKRLVIKPILLASITDQYQFSDLKSETANTTRFDRLSVQQRISEAHKSAFAATRVYDYNKTNPSANIRSRQVVLIIFENSLLIEVSPQFNTVYASYLISNLIHITRPATDIEEVTLTFNNRLMLTYTFPKRDLFILLLHQIFASTVSFPNYHIKHTIINTILSPINYDNSLLYNTQMHVRTPPLSIDSSICMALINDPHPNNEPDMDNSDTHVSQLLKDKDFNENPASIAFNSLNVTLQQLISTKSIKIDNNSDLFIRNLATYMQPSIQLSMINTREYLSKVSIFNANCKAVSTLGPEFKLNFDALLFIFSFLPLVPFDTSMYPDLLTICLESLTFISYLLKTDDNVEFFIESDEMIHRLTTCMVLNHDATSIETSKILTSIIRLSPSVYCLQTAINEQPSLSSSSLFPNKLLLKEKIRREKILGYMLNAKDDSQILTYLKTQKSFNFKFSFMLNSSDLIRSSTTTFQNLNKSSHPMLPTSPPPFYVWQVIIFQLFQFQPVSDTAIYFLFELIGCILCQPYSDSTPDNFFYDMLYCLSTNGDQLLKFFTHPSENVVTTTGLLMKILSEEMPQFCNLMREAAMRKGILLEHIYKSIYSQDPTEKSIAQQMVCIWSDGYPEAMQLIKNIFPPGLVDHFKKIDIDDLIEMSNSSEVSVLDAVSDAQSIGSNESFKDSTLINSNTTSGTTNLIDNLSSEDKQRLKSMLLVEKNLSKLEQENKKLRNRVAARWDWRRIIYAYEDVSDSFGETYEQYKEQMTIKAQEARNKAFEIGNQTSSAAQSVAKSLKTAAMNSAIADKKQWVFLLEASGLKDPIIRKRPKKYEVSDMSTFYLDWNLLFDQLTMDFHHPRLIWNEKTRNELKLALEREIKIWHNEDQLGGFNNGNGFLSLSNTHNTELSWNYLDFRVPYESLKGYLKISDYYLQLLIQDSVDIKLLIGNNSDASITSLFHMLFQKLFLEDSKELKLLCISGMTMLYKHFYEKIQNIDGIDYLIKLFDQSKHIEIRHGLANLFAVLLSKNLNLEREFVTLHGIDLVCKMIAVHQHHSVGLTHTPQDMNTSSNEVEGESISTVSPGWTLELKHNIECEIPTSKHEIAKRCAQNAINISSAKGNVVNIPHSTSYLEQIDTIDVGEHINNSDTLVPLETLSEIRWTILITQSHKSLIQTHILLLLDILCILIKGASNFDKYGHLIRPAPLPHRSLASLINVQLLSQCLISSNNDIANRIIDLLTLICFSNDHMLSHIHKSGAILFFLMNNAASSNFIKVAKLLKLIRYKSGFSNFDPAFSEYFNNASAAKKFLGETDHRQGNVKNFSKKRTSSNGIFNSVFPESMLRILDTREHTDFARIYESNVNLPNVIWDSLMRDYMIQQIKQHVESLVEALPVQNLLLYDYLPFPKIYYKNLDTEIWCHSIFLTSYVKLHRSYEDISKLVDISQDLVPIMKSIGQYWKRNITDYSRLSLEVDGKSSATIDTKDAVEQGLVDAMLFFGLIDNNDKKNDLILKDQNNDDISISTYKKAILKLSQIDEKTLRSVYRKLALQYHPDKNVENNDLFNKVTRSYEILIKQMAETCAAEDDGIGEIVDNNLEMGTHNRINAIKRGKLIHDLGVLIQSQDIIYSDFYKSMSQYKYPNLRILIGTLQVATEIKGEEYKLQSLADGLVFQCVKLLHIVSKNSILNAAEVGAVGEQYGMFIQPYFMFLIEDLQKMAAYYQQESNINSLSSKGTAPLAIAGNLRMGDSDTNNNKSIMVLSTPNDYTSSTSKSTMSVQTTRTILESTMDTLRLALTHTKNPCFSISKLFDKVVEMAENVEFAPLNSSIMLFIKSYLNNYLQDCSVQMISRIIKLLFTNMKQFSKTMEINTILAYFQHLQLESINGPFYKSKSQLEQSSENSSLRPSYVAIYCLETLSQIISNSHENQVAAASIKKRVSRFIVPKFLIFMQSLANNTTHTFQNQEPPKSIAYFFQFGLSMHEYLPELNYNNYTSFNESTQPIVDALNIYLQRPNLNDLNYTTHNINSGFIIDLVILLRMLNSELYLPEIIWGHNEYNEIMRNYEDADFCYKEIESQLSISGVYVNLFVHGTESRWISQPILFYIGILEQIDCNLKLVKDGHVKLDEMMVYLLALKKLVDINYIRLYKLRDYHVKDKRGRKCDAAQDELISIYLDNKGLFAVLSTLSVDMSLDISLKNICLEIIGCLTDHSQFFTYIRADYSHFVVYILLHFLSPVQSEDNASDYHSLHINIVTSIVSHISLAKVASEHGLMLYLMNCLFSKTYSGQYKIILCDLIVLLLQDETIFEMNKSLLYAILPVKLIGILKSGTGTLFYSQFIKDISTPDLSWNSIMRKEMGDNITKVVDSFSSIQLKDPPSVYFDDSNYLDDLKIGVIATQGNNNKGSKGHDGSAMIKANGIQLANFRKDPSYPIEDPDLFFSELIKMLIIEIKQESNTETVLLVLDCIIGMHREYPNIANRPSSKHTNNIYQLLDSVYTKLSSISDHNALKMDSDEKIIFKILFILLNLTDDSNREVQGKVVIKKVISWGKLLSVVKLAMRKTQSTPRIVAAALKLCVAAVSVPEIQPLSAFLDQIYLDKFAEFLLFQISGDSEGHEYSLFDSKYKAVEILKLLTLLSINYPSSTIPHAGYFKTLIGQSASWDDYKNTNFELYSQGEDEKSSTSTLNLAITE